MADEKKTGGGMTVREAGRKGGQKARDERGHKFYEEIGRKGGETVRNERGHEFYEEIGHKGGQKVKELIALAREDKLIPANLCAEVEEPLQRLASTL